MIGDLLNNNKRRNVRTSVNQMFYDGVKYSLEKSTGYYVCTTGSRKRLHDVLWTRENIDGIKEIPDDYVVHHVDWNKNHNEISNLTCISVFGHNLIHNPPKNSRYKVKIVAGGMSEVIDTTRLRSCEQTQGRE